jgi:hypothetical protein
MLIEKPTVESDVIVFNHSEQIEMLLDKINQIGKDLEQGSSGSSFGRKSRLKRKTSKKLAGKRSLLSPPLQDRLSAAAAAGSNSTEETKQQGEEEVEQGISSRTVAFALLRKLATESISRAEQN